MLMAAAILCILVIRPTFDSLWIAVLIYGGMIVGMILAFMYSNRLSSGIAGAMLGSGGKMKQERDHGDDLITERKYDEAVEFYLKKISKKKKNAVLRLKVADLYLKLRDHKNCIKYMEEAVRLPKGLPLDEQCARINRLADLYLKHKHDRAAAINALKLILQNHPKSRHAVYARERIAGLKKDA
jgi:tetratricopeptide (TPR) repeat protein